MMPHSCELLAARFTTRLLYAADGLMMMVKSAPFNPALSPAVSTPGVDTAGLKAGLSGADFTIIVKKSVAYNNLVVNLAASDSQLWGIKLYTPTELSNGDPKRSTLTLTAAAA